MGRKKSNLNQGKEPTRERRKLPAPVPRSPVKMMKAKAVNEEIAIKWGLSIGVPREGDAVKEEEAEPTEAWSVNNSVSIFVRGRSWLEVHGIVDRSNPSGQTKTPEPGSHEIVTLDD